MIAIVLAAGHGRRMGGPKALLIQEDGVALAWAHALVRTDCRNTLIVTRQSIAHILRKHRPATVSAELIESTEEDELGPAGSIRAAVQHLAFNEAELVLLTPVDCSPASADEVQQLLRAIEGFDVARPRVGKRGGHPVLVRASVLEAYRHSARPLRDVFRELGPQRVRDVAMSNPARLHDFDRPSDLQRTPRFLE